MEIDEIYKRFHHINPALINELYRTFKNQVLHSGETDTEDNRKTNLAVAFGNLLAYEPDSITNFHFKQLENLFSELELEDLFCLYELILDKKSTNSNQFFSNF